jgi:lambda family phage portal protein
MVQLNMLSRLWTSELVAANWDADRLAVLQTQSGTDPNEVTSPEETGKDLPSDLGTILALDPGQEMKFFPPNHPNSVLPQFTSYLLKGAASSLNVAYHSLSGDLAESKFSSDRTALVQERDGWRLLQGWLIRRFCNPVYQAWLEAAMFHGAVSIPVADPARACAPRWAARNWDWVDPLKDVQASTQAIAFGLSTYQDELGAQGKAWEEVFEQRAREQEKARSLGLVLEAKPSTTVNTTEEPGGEDPQGEGGKPGEGK